MGRPNLSDVLGDRRARKYDGQAEVVKLETEDEKLVQKKILGISMISLD